MSYKLRMRIVHEFSIIKGRIAMPILLGKYLAGTLTSDVKCHYTESRKIKYACLPVLALEPYDCLLLPATIANQCPFARPRL